MSKDFKQNVERGVIWLNNNIRGWETRINLYDLDMRHYRKCVLSQACDSAYIEATYEYDLQFDECVELGFTVCVPNLIHEEAEKLWSILTQQWHYEIHKLQEIAGCKKS